VNELSWPIGHAARAGRIGRAGRTIIQSITDTVRYWRRYKKAQHTLMAVPQHLLGDLGICRKQISAIAAYAAVAQVDIAAAIDHVAGLPPAPLPASRVR
jgi:uncharacterized protein YjiS (DUF1127 family)